MNKEDVIRMAWEAGFVIVQDSIIVNCESTPFHVLCTESINRFAAIVAAVEREACAKLVDEMEEDMRREMEPSPAIAYVRRKAAAIRARGLA